MTWRTANKRRRKAERRKVAAEVVVRWLTTGEFGQWFIMEIEKLARTT